MNIKELSYFLELTKLKNFTKVAEHFHVRQPTVTSGIQRLEREVNATLLKRDRSHREVVVTPLGEQFAVHVQSILCEWNIAQKELEHLKQEQIRFGVSPTIASYYIPKVSSELDEIQLISQMKMSETGSEALIEQLENGQIDLALLATMAPITKPTLQSIILAHTKFKIIVSPENSLAKQPSVRFKALKGQRFLTLSESFVHAVAFKKLTHKYRMHPEIIYQGNNISLLKGLVAQNVGIGFLTELAIQPTDPVTALAIDDVDQPEFIVTLVYRTSHLLTESQQQIVRILEQVNNK